MTNFINTTNSFDTSERNEYNRIVEKILKSFKLKTNEIQFKKMTEDKSIKAFWILGWESDEKDGVWLGTILITFKGKTVGTLTLCASNEIITWINSDFEFELFDYVKGFAS